MVAFLNDASVNIFGKYSFLRVITILPFTLSVLVIVTISPAKAELEIIRLANRNAISKYFFIHPPRLKEIKNSYLLSFLSIFMSATKFQTRGEYCLILRITRSLKSALFFSDFLIFVWTSASVF